MITNAKAAYAAHSEELKAAYDRIARLEADLTECLDYFEERYDADDGRPCREMQLGTMLEQTLYGRPYR